MRNTRFSLTPSATEEEDTSSDSYSDQDEEANEPFSPPPPLALETRGLKGKQTVKMQQLAEEQAKKKRAKIGKKEQKEQKDNKRMKKGTAIDKLKAAERARRVEEDVIDVDSIIINDDEIDMPAVLLTKAPVQSMVINGKVWILQQ
jgi:hypothetical protein